MIDIQILRHDPQAVAAKLAARGLVFDTAAFEATEARRKALQVKTEELQAERNSTSKQIGALKSQGKHDEANAAMAEVGRIKTELEQTEAEYLVEKGVNLVSAHAGLTLNMEDDGGVNIAGAGTHD